MKFTRRQVTGAMLSLPVALGLAGTASAAESAAEFYKGKTITAIAPAGPESTFTLLSQVMAPYMEKYTGASVIVKPMQAGGGFQARNFMADADPDGLTVVLVGHGPKMITGSMFETAGVHYDWSKFVPLGKVPESGFVVFVARDSDWQTPLDMQGKSFNFGESSPFFGPQLAEAFGWDKMHVIPGYRSSAARATAVARGEIQATSGSIELMAAQPDAVKMMATGIKLSDYPDVPTVVEAATEGGEKWARLIEGWMALLYMSYAPPGTPDDRADFLEAALKQTWADPDFAADIKKMDLAPASGDFPGRARLKGYMETLSAMSPDEVKELNFVINEKYKKK